MALITDPDSLNQGTEITIDTGLRTLTLNQAGNLSTDGVTLQALYSFLKEEWKNDSALIPHPFPMIAITPEQFEFIENWKPVDDSTRQLIRTGGWAEVDASGTTNREYFGVITLGNIDAGDAVYYFFDSDSSATNFNFDGPVNEAVQFFGDVDNGDFDKRSETFTVRIRVFGKTYDESTTTAIGVGTITNKVERFPLAEASDPVVSDLGVTTTDIDNNTPYTDMSIGYANTAQVRSGFTTGNSSFGVIVDGDVSIAQEDGGGVATAEEIYAFVQRQLIRTTDINDGAVGDPGTSVIGRLAEELLILGSTGATLSTVQQSSNPGGDGTGVYVDSFSSNDKNRIEFVDNSGTTVSFPFVAAGSINFNNNLVNDGNAEYWMFFEYTTRTSISDLTLSSVTGSNASVDSSGGEFPTLTQNDYVALDGFTNANNNGIWQVTDASPTSSQFDATKWNGDPVVAEGPVSGTLDQDPINSPDAIIVDDNAGTDVTGTVSGSSASFDFDYDGNTQGGRTAGTDAPIVLRAIGLNTAQFIEATGTITRNTGLSFSLVAALERNYNNP